MTQDLILEKIQLVKKGKDTSLVITESDIESLPSEIEDLYWLESLFLSFNSLTNLSFLRHLTALKKLDLRGNNLHDIGPIENLQNLEYLDLDKNYITSIKPLANLKNLGTLYLSDNKIENTLGLGKLNNLFSLNLENNKIKDISELSNISSLTFLNLKANEIEEISGLSEIQSLEYLNISKNQILSLPEFNKAKNLKRLIIGSNSISDITPIVDALENNLSLGNESQIDEKASNNPLTTPPPEIVSQGTNSILRYFAEIKRQGFDKIYEAKLLIIGEGGAGKTSLVRKLQNNKCDLPNEFETTFGINITRFPIQKMPDGKTFYLNIWDFGGQEIYHSTHQFFLTNRSLYVLLDDTRKDDKGVNDSAFSYWLQVIELLGGNSPLLIIQNEKADRSKAIDLPSMQARFNFIKECKQTNLLTNRGLHEIYNSILYWSSQLPHIGETLPKQWIEIRKYIEKLSEKENHISIQEYLKICSAHKIPEESRALNLSNFLHDLGVFLHYQNDETLKNILILKNSWATDAVYKIMDDEQIKKNHGFFSSKDLFRLWSNIDYKYHHHVLLALMEKFELCYRVSKEIAEDKWLAPQLLSITSPEFEWNFNSNIQIKYEYTFMPKGLLSRLIVRLNRYIKDFNLAWRSGVILERKSTTALIREIYATKIITLNVEGNYAKEFATIITEELDDLNSTFKNIKVQKLIQCICQHCKEIQEPHFYVYDNLQNRIANGRQTVECDLSYKTLNVKNLLDGIFANVHRKKYQELKLFISYSHQDKELKDELLKHLTALKITKNLTFWEDNQILAGQKWDDEIKENIRNADIILLLISSDFIASKYIWEEELSIAISRDKDGDAIVIPIFIRECDTDNMPFMTLQGLPPNAKPVSKFKDKDDAFTEISKGITRRLNKFEQNI